MEVKLNTSEWITFGNGELFIEGQKIELPGYEIISELDRGANAIVFRANEKRLNREVAIKIWNKKGRFRAQAETQKIAMYDHPLVVRTYYFSEAEGFPFAVMELVNGLSGKLWLKENPDLKTRIKIWKLYSQSLTAIYSLNTTHGDPHLGNILVTRDFNEELTMKIADAGTSDFRGDKKLLLARESKIILETAQRLFVDIDFNELWRHPENLTHKKTLELLDESVSFLEIITAIDSYDRKAQNASKIIDIVFTAPLFDLDKLISLAKEYAHIEDRVVLYLNKSLLNKKDCQEVGFTLLPESREKYRILQKSYLKGLVESV